MSITSATLGQIDINAGITPERFAIDIIGVQFGDSMPYYAMSGFSTILRPTMSGLAWGFYQVNVSYDNRNHGSAQVLAQIVDSNNNVRYNQTLFFSVPTNIISSQTAEAPPQIILLPDSLMTGSYKLQLWFSETENPGFTASPTRTLNFNVTEENLTVNPSTPITPIPQTSPNLPNEQYRMVITTNVNPTLPSWLISQLRSAFSLGGWDLNDIAKTSTGYELILYKKGSIVTLALLATLALALKVLGVVILSWAVVRISDGFTERSNNALQVKTEDNNLAMSILSDPTLDDAQKSSLLTQLIGKTNNDDNGFFDNVGDYAGIGVLALFALAALSLSRR